LLSIEEYIAKRKKEENVDEFDQAERTNNTRACVDFVFEYFNDYLDIAHEKDAAMKREKSDRHRNQLVNYEGRVLEWLEDYYAE
jgi:hypothetical protein